MFSFSSLTNQPSLLLTALSLFSHLADHRELLLSKVQENTQTLKTTESQPPTHTVPTTVFDETHPDEPTTSDPQMNTDVSEITVLADMETDPEPLSSVSHTLNDDMETDVSDHTSQRTCPNITSSSTVNQPEVHEVFPNTHTEPEPAHGFSLNSDKSQDCPPSELLLTDPLINTDTSVLYDISHDISIKMSKLGKEQSQKFQRRLLQSENILQSKESQKRKERVKYALDEKYKAKKKSYSSQRSSKEELRKAKQKYDTNVYRNNPEIQKKKINNIKTRYRESTDFRLKQKAYITRRYTEDIDFRQRQQSYITQRYAHDEVFCV
ncbi:uncharacterized protein LOC117821670 isoform X2 [Notolabrus celidotus]|uniref:uncharacterized protein LOC117821670 isoform X2 n=1 Tax=Notolabrus celidotus TaxID=1203425 RepID=UPI00148FDA33|nr:uncharacterized protein LOC117821670 isoform X2 [Notolabrus celidotus]